MENQATFKTSVELSGQSNSRPYMPMAFLIAALMLLVLAPLFWRQALGRYYGDKIHTVESAEPARAAIVFGAAVYSGGRLSTVLRDRMDTAIELYRAGKVDKLLVSGDNSHSHYNEPGAMMAYAIRNGVPEADIQPDYAGLRTYDTCYRALHVFQVRQAILVTQAFHLPRALFTCRQLGVDASGTEADRRPYRGARWYEIRETVAATRALWDVLRQRPAQVVGEPIPLQ